MASCCVTDCSSKREISKNVILFSLPEHLSYEWRKVINRPGNWEPKKRTVICERHFAKSDYCAITKKLAPGATPLRTEELVSIVSGVYILSICKASSNNEDRKFSNGNRIYRILK